MIYTITIIGRPNVGKSTLFNYLLDKKKSLVNNIKNSTRDRNYGYIEIKNKKFIIIDTGGIDNLNDEIQIKVASQVFSSIKNSNIILFLVDCEEGLILNDKIFNKYIYEFKDKIFLITNKIDKLNYNINISDFYSLGISNKIYPISAYNGYGVDYLFKKILFFLKKKKIKNNFLENKKLLNKIPIKFVIIGKPNVGKSTLINYILKEERMIVHKLSGTTKDYIYIPAIYKNKKYIIIDTPGIKNIKKNKNLFLKKIIKKSNIIVFLLDINYEISVKELFLINFIIKNFYPLILVFNKIDKINNYNYIKFKKNIIYRLKFIKNIHIKFISSLYGIGVDNLFKSINKTYKSLKKKINTSKLNKIMNEAILNYQPPLHNGKYIKLKYAHLGNYTPYTIIIHGNNVNKIKNLYKKYLINFFIKSLNILGKKILIKFKECINPYN